MAHSQEQAFTCLGRGDAARGASQQPQAESCLQPANGVTQRRLGNPKLCSGPGEASFPRDSEEGEKIVKIFVLHL